MAFRHVEVDDPLSGCICFPVQCQGCRQGISLQYPIHTFFTVRHAYGQVLARLAVVSVEDSIEVSIWTGRAAHGARFACQWQAAILVAPEGAPTVTVKLSGPLEPGVYQLGFGAHVEVKAGRSKPCTLCQSVFGIATSEATLASTGPGC